ncbi:MAG: hypothetical protein R3F62_31975 [Planctomycetota bacterium]
MALGLPWAWALLGGAVTVAVACGALALERARGVGPCLAALAAGALLALSVGAAVFVPWVDAQKGLGRFLTESARKVPRDRPVFVYRPDETARGAIPFYGGRLATPVYALDGLAPAAEDRYVYVIDKHADLRLLRELDPLHPEVVAALERPRTRSIHLLRLPGTPR